MVVPDVGGVKALRAKHHREAHHGFHLFPGEHDRSGEQPGHPEALRPQGERPLRPGGGDVLADGGAGPHLHLHRRLRLLPQAAGGGALRLQRAPGGLRLQVVEPGDVNGNRAVDRDGGGGVCFFKSS